MALQGTRGHLGAESEARPSRVSVLACVHLWGSSWFPKSKDRRGDRALSPPPTPGSDPECRARIMMGQGCRSSHRHCSRGPFIFLGPSATGADPVLQLSFQRCQEVACPRSHRSFAVEQDSAPVAAPRGPARFAVRWSGFQTPTPPPGSRWPGLPELCRPWSCLAVHLADCVALG